MNLEKLAVALFEACQDKTAKVSDITESLIVEQFGFFPNSREAVEDVVRKYKNSGTGLEDSASQIIALMGGSVEVKQETKLESVSVVSEPVNSAAAVKLDQNYTIHNGQVVSLIQEERKNPVYDSTRPELKGIPVSNDYFRQRVQELFGEEVVTYRLDNLAENIIGQGKIFDLALVQTVNNPETGKIFPEKFLYEGVLYSGWKMQNEQQIAEETEKREAEMEKRRVESAKKAAAREATMESLGLDKFDNPDKVYHLYLALSEQDEDFVFNVNLVEEEGDGQLFYYNEEEYRIVDECEVSDEYYEQEVEYIRENPHDYVYDACYSEMAERLYGWDSKILLEENDFYVIKQ